ncbi:MAG: hypothetical protein K1X89_21955, partial [Myxococcaceae bacterium]|nr:hypothetical protein [Myxococcaceae bacterium]
MDLSFIGSDPAPGRDQLASSETELDQAELSLQEHHQKLEARRKALDAALAGAKSSEEDGPLRTFASDARLPAVAVQHPFDEAQAARAKAVAARRKATRVIAERLASFELELGHVEQQLAEAQAAERAHAEARRLEAA